MINFIEVEDYKELEDLADIIWHEYWIDLLSKEQIDYMLKKFQSIEAFENQIQNENYIYFYIQNDTEKIGYIGLSHRENDLFLSKFYIKRDYRKKGIGSKTFEFIKHYAKELDYKKITLTVNKNNKNTILIYQKMGFEKIESVITPIGEGFVMDDYIMEYKIK